MLLPKVTCLPSFDASLVCYLASTAAPRRRLGGRPGGLLYTQDTASQHQHQDASAGAGAVGWTRWLVHPDEDGGGKSTLAAWAKPYLKLGFLFGEPEFGLSPEVALPMYLQPVVVDGDDHDESTEKDLVTIASDQIGKQLACTAAGTLYTADTGDDAARADTTWRCEWHTPEVCAVVHVERGMRLNVVEPTPGMVVSDGGVDVPPPVPQETSASLSLLNTHARQVPTTQWRFHEHFHDGSVAVCTHDDRHVLGDDWEGGVTLSDASATVVPTWWIRRTSSRGVVLQSKATRRYLRVDAETGRFGTRPQEQADPSSSSDALFSLEPVHGSKFHLRNDAHGRVKSLQDVLIKVFDNGNVIIKRDGQFFGKCYYQHDENEKHKKKYLGIGFREDPYVWHMEPVASGGVRICTKGPGRQFLRHDGTTYALGDTEDLNNREFLWHVESTDKRLQIGLRYGLLNRDLQRRANKEWPGVEPFQPTLCMKGKYQRPFANWRQWPIEAVARVAAKNGAAEPQQQQVQLPVPPQTNGAATTPSTPPVAAATTTTTTAANKASPPKDEDEVSRQLRLALEKAFGDNSNGAAATVGPPAWPTPAQQPVAVEAPQPAAPQQAAEPPAPPPAQPVAETAPPQVVAPPVSAPAVQVPMPVVPQPAAVQQQTSPVAAAPPVALESLPKIGNHQHQEGYVQANPAPQPDPVQQQSAPVPQENIPPSPVPAEETGFRAFAADDKKVNSPGTQWPEHDVKSNNAGPTPPPPPPRTMNGRPLTADSMLDNGRPVGPSYFSSATDEEPRQPRVFSVDR